MQKRRRKSKEHSGLDVHPSLRKGQALVSKSVLEDRNDEKMDISLRKELNHHP